MKPRKESMRDSYNRRQREKMKAELDAGTRKEWPSASFKRKKAPKPQKPKKPLKKVSEKRKAENVLYEKAKRQWRAEHDGRCEMLLYIDEPTYRNSRLHQCTQQAMHQPHHVRKRLGGNLADKSTFLGLCFEHHTWVHDHEKRAREMGWLEA